MKNKSKTLFTDILLWAFEKQTQGFTRLELDKAIDIKENDPTQADLRRWIQHTFYSGTNDNPPLIDFFTSKGENDFYALSRAGMIAAIDYIELCEARKSSKVATRIAFAAIAISVIALILQMVLPQSVKLRNDKVKGEVFSSEGC